MNKFKIISLSMILLSLVTSVNAEIYKHIDTSGKIIFSDEKTNDSKKIDIKSTNISASTDPRFVNEMIYKGTCSFAPLKSEICSIEVLEKRSDFAMLRIHYHYIKGDEYSNKIVVKANKGSHDNVVGTQGGFDLIEGNNIINIPFGMYKSDIYTETEPYLSKYIMVEAKGITEDGKRYTTPHIFRVFADYSHPWYIRNEKRSW